jgi:hypothetical protein
MHHRSIAYLLTLVLFQEQGLQGTAQAVTSSLDDGAEKGSTPDLQTPPAVCHLEDLHVNFTDLGVTSILIPQSANIGECIGSCPGHSGLKVNHYYTLRRIIHGRELCCIPIQFGPLTTLRTKEGNLHVEDLENLVVKKCGCR